MKPVTVTLRDPVKLTPNSEPITTLVMKPSGRFYKDHKLKAGAGAVDFEPHALAVIGVKMAGHGLLSEKIVDEMNPADMMEIAQAVMVFLTPGEETGPSVSPS